MFKACYTCGQAVNPKGVVSVDLPAVLSCLDGSIDRQSGGFAAFRKGGHRLMKLYAAFMLGGNIEYLMGVRRTEEEAKQLVERNALKEKIFDSSYLSNDDGYHNFEVRELDTDPQQALTTGIVLWQFNNRHPKQLSAAKVVYGKHRALLSDYEWKKVERE
jgi:hypothetical protein